MTSFVLGRLFSLLLALRAIGRYSNHAKDLHILLLQQQLPILQRKQPRPPRLSRRQKLILAVLTTQLLDVTGGARAHLDDVVLLFKPDTVLKWHRELVRRTWTFTRCRTSGRPAIAPELEALILRLAKEHPRWGSSKLHGEPGAQW